MAFRSHIGRSFDFSLASNRLIAGLVAVAAVAGVTVVLSSGQASAWLTPVYTLLIWALLRELDPDHDSTAIIGGLAAGLWVLAGLDASAWLAFVGFLLAARLVLNSTGRRPLGTDLAAMVILAALISFSAVGWMAGFGLALAIYVDDRMADEHKISSALAAVLAALSASAVATLSGAFPSELPDVQPLIVVGMGLLALAAVVREPEPPASLVDSWSKTPMEQGRLHGARGLVGVLVFAAAVLEGPNAIALGPGVIALALALGSNELERTRRRR